MFILYGVDLTVNEKDWQINNFRQKRLSFEHFYFP